MSTEEKKNITKVRNKNLFIKLLIIHAIIYSI